MAILLILSTILCLILLPLNVSTASVSSNDETDSGSDSGPETIRPPSSSLILNASFIQSKIIQRYHPSRHLKRPTVLLKVPGESGMLAASATLPSLPPPPPSQSQQQHPTYPTANVLPSTTTVSPSSTELNSIGTGTGTGSGNRNQPQNHRFQYAFSPSPDSKLHSFNEKWLRGHPEEDSPGSASQSNRNSNNFNLAFIPIETAMNLNHNINYSQHTIQKVNSIFNSATGVSGSSAVSLKGPSPTSAASSLKSHTYVLIPKSEKTKENRNNEDAETQEEDYSASELSSSISEEELTLPPSTSLFRQQGHHFHNQHQQNPTPKPNPTYSNNLLWSSKPQVTIHSRNGKSEYHFSSLASSKPEPIFPPARNLLHLNRNQHQTVSSSSEESESQEFKYNSGGSGTNKNVGSTSTNTKLNQVVNSKQNINGQPADPLPSPSPSSYFPTATVPTLLTTPSPTPLTAQQLQQQHQQDHPPAQQQQFVSASRRIGLDVDDVSGNTADIDRSFDLNHNQNLNDNRLNNFNPDYYNFNNYGSSELENIAVADDDQISRYFIKTKPREREYYHKEFHLSEPVRESESDSGSLSLSVSPIIDFTSTTPFAISASVNPTASPHLTDQHPQEQQQQQQIHYSENNNGENHQENHYANTNVNDFRFISSSGGSNSDSNSDENENGNGNGNNQDKTKLGGDNENDNVNHGTSGVLSSQELQVQQKLQQRQQQQEQQQHQQLQQQQQQQVLQSQPKPKYFSFDHSHTSTLKPHHGQERSFETLQSYNPSSIYSYHQQRVDEQASAPATLTNLLPGGSGGHKYGEYGFTSPLVSALTAGESDPSVGGPTTPISVSGTGGVSSTTDATSIPGMPGIDYPILGDIPFTGFDCQQQRYKGFFADIATKCQAWHYCDFTDGHSTFLCPNGTLFSQVLLTCDWWFNVDCSQAQQLYVLNERLYRYIKPPKPSFPEDFHGPQVDLWLAQQLRLGLLPKMKKKVKDKVVIQSSN